MDEMEKRPTRERVSEREGRKKGQGVSGYAYTHYGGTGRREINGKGDKRRAVRANNQR